MNQFKLLNWYTKHPLYIYIYIYIRERELKEKIENIEKTKISFEKENGELKKKNEWLISSLQKFSNGQ